MYFLAESRKFDQNSVVLFGVGSVGTQFESYNLCI